MFFPSESCSHLSGGGGCVGCIVAWSLLICVLMKWIGIFTGTSGSQGQVIAAPGYSAFCGFFKSKPHRSPATPHLIFVFILMDHSFQKKSEHCWLASQEGRSTKSAVHICTRKTEVWWIHFGFIMVEGKPQAWQPKIPLFRAQTTKVMEKSHPFMGFVGITPDAFS